MPDNVPSSSRLVVVPTPRASDLYVPAPTPRPVPVAGRLDPVHAHPGRSDTAITCPTKIAAVVESMEWHAKPWWRRRGPRPPLDLPRCPGSRTSLPLPLALLWSVAAG